MSDTTNTTDTVLTVHVKVTNVAGDKVSFPMDVEGVIALDNARLVRRAVRAGIVTADNMDAMNQMHRHDKHTGLELRRGDVSRMRDELATAPGLKRNGMLKALLKGI